MSHNYVKLLAKFNAYREAAHESKSEVIVHAYKSGYLDCKRGDAPYHSIEDEDVELLCLEIPLA
ncbi:unnamed protein product [Prunus armeniaca]